MMPRRVILTAVAAVFLMGAAPDRASAGGYPRLGFYGSIHGNGSPYTLADGSLDTATIAEVARYDAVVLDVSPISPYRPDIAAALRARHPGIRLFAYLMIEDYYPSNDADSANHIPTIVDHALRTLDGYLYDKNTGQPIVANGVNLARRDASGRFVVADTMADILRDRVIATGTWDGVFTDIFCHTIAWIQSGTSVVIDYQLAGYASLAALDAAWSVAADTFATRLRADIGPDAPLIGNCGPSGEYPLYNGWLRENFPAQDGGTWYANILADPHGSLADDRDMRHPTFNLISTAFFGLDGQQYTADNARRVRLGLASASLGEAYHSFNTPDKNSQTAPYQNYWYDEYAVDVATGRSSTSLADTGWLGDALAPWSQMIWIGTNPDAVTNSGFETDVTTGWTFVTFSPGAGTRSRDTTTAAVGGASARITVTSAGAADWQVGFTTTGSIPMTAYRQYAVTFWAKASSPRLIHFVANNTGAGAYAYVDTTWRQQQVVMVPTTSMNGALGVWLGGQTGDVWLDDVHLQADATSLYRRDFQHGIVLVNPSDGPLQVPLEAPFQRILGTVDPVTNNGSTASAAAVPARDALFLLRTVQDVTPPGPVRDLTVRP